jgi:hypothetical protein
MKLCALPTKHIWFTLYHATSCREKVGRQSVGRPLCLRFACGLCPNSSSECEYAHLPPQPNSSKMAKFKPLLDVVAKAIAPEHNSSKQHATSSSSASGGNSGNGKGQQPQEGGGGATVTQLTFPSLQVIFTSKLKHRPFVVSSTAVQCYESTISFTSYAIKAFKSHCTHSLSA